MARAPVRKKDDLDRLAEGDPKNVIALMLWANRHQNPEMAVKIEPKHLEGFGACVQYLKVKPSVRIIRPQGRPEQAPIPAQGQRRAVPGYPAEPPKPFVVVQLVDEGTENGIRPVENNEADNELRIIGEKTRRARDQAPDMAARLDRMAGQGAEISASDLRDAAEALRLLAR